VLRRILDIAFADKPLLRRMLVFQALQSVTYIPFVAGVGWFVENRGLG
jgi:hypothetical protein